MDLKKIIDKYAHIWVVWNIINSIIKRYQKKDILNINLDLTSKTQKRILICYVSTYGVDIANTYHALYSHLNQIIKCLIDQDFIIDLCDCLDLTSPQRFISKEYDVILGQGPAYIDICKNHPRARKILFCTENNPVVVEKKYKERAEYFAKRHPDLVKFIKKRRIIFFTEEHLKISDELILMNSKYNEASFKDYFDNPYRINVNAVVNPAFDISKLNDDIGSIKKNFLVFVCTGFIHKGIDILLDAFKEMLDINLLIFGINEGEKLLFSKLKSENTYDCGFVNVASEDFLTKVVSRSLFVILPSCSEGMSSGIATCMSHGLIPIITKDCGFDDNDDIIELPDYSVESIRKTIKRIINIEDKELKEKRRRLIDYSNSQFSINLFSNSFKSIFNEIVESNNIKD